ncbi:MSHA pilin protein MshA [Idiomarina loihiensis]|jgi:MSHA pilin protein MshA|uniref:prepilin-type N-terminal cleavage/methylation domain-containing protein n=2 Tax=Idiomarinaceae TaxID=267893 RepID=UPI000C59E1DD|nr:MULTISPECIES: type II secretion system protein [Idiomarina]MAA62269.1 hypothetical protein [Idiomarina sp.]PWW37521.1 MSHA pilin protein MshA [Idiomarina loihiensis]TDP47572.1 MSHA pilin protein MshA [Idiomarina loihiensis]TDS23313.1 MSHA pilin protein MshA [Idiomarina sp. H2]|tara:strand:+ start:518 stop:1018 length:501 start_codon:yes stop_codon:yes gene_type:complete
MRNQKGFTLIELIIVIVVLGILAVTAAPQFINFAGDARSGTLDGVRASMQSASTLINAKAKVQGTDESQTTDATNSPTVSNNGTDIAVAYGYPDAVEIDGLLDINAGDFGVVYETGTDAEEVSSTLIYAVGQGVPEADATSGCFVRYSEPTSAGSKPEYEKIDDGC